MDHGLGFGPGPGPEHVLFEIAMPKPKEPSNLHYYDLRTEQPKSTESSMLRRATTGLLLHHRRLSTEAASSDELFIAAWRRIMPNIDPPKTPLSFVHSSPDVIPSKLTVNLVSPYSSLVFNKQVDMLTVPATSGLMGILPGHISSISELKPGVLSIHEDHKVTEYFISSGFAFVHSNSITDIIAIEAVPIEQIDPSCVQKGLEEYNQKLNSALTDMETAEARLGIDVLTALDSALSEYQIDS